MAKLKDVAELAGVSIAAVSLYINGKSKGRVSPETQRKIEQALSETNYHHKSSDNSHSAGDSAPEMQTVLIFWSVNFKRTLLGSLITGIQDTIREFSLNSNYDFVIRPYNIDELYKHKRTLCTSQYHAALIVSASLMDLQFLQTITPQIPIVLVNRNVPNYHCVYIDSEKVGQQAAQLIQEKGYASVCTVSSQSQYIAINSRFLAFISACRERGISIPNEFQIITEDSISHGEKAADEYLSHPNRPSLIFTTTESLGFGVLRRLQHRGIAVPEECGVFSYGFERTELAKYSNPPLSVIDISTSALAATGMQLIIDILQKGITVPQHIELPSKIQLRDSF